MDDYIEENDDDYPINDNLPEEERWERGCLFGAECLMSSDHMKVECYTREMAEAWAIEYSEGTMIIKRTWAMPSADTFSVKPIGDLVRKYLATSHVSIDPFARNKQWATFTNDLNPKTSAQCHMDAVDFLEMLGRQGVHADLLIFDPPYSPRQISECYAEAGMKAGMKDTQNARLYSACRNAALPVLSDESIVISCGWNSAGMGEKRGFEILEILMVCHGGAHNDTLTVVERRLPIKQGGLF